MFTPKDVLISIREYIRSFFSCGPCRTHFLEMAESIETDVNSKEEGVLWMWRKHNQVNMRLHGDETEDRKHPKVQFPTYTMCPQCHRTMPYSDFEEADWDEEAVLDYLIKFYGAQNIIADSVPYVFQANKDYFAGANQFYPNFLLALLSPLTMYLH